MKQLIIPFFIVVALIAFFIVIDRKDFYPGGDVAVRKEAVTGKKPTTETTFKPVEKPAETKPAEVKTPETKPVTGTKQTETKPVTETKPTTVKPVETKPVAETKPVETKPMVETKPVETKPAETKPVKTTPVAEEKLAPAAIPVVTAEEAKKLNAEAIEYAITEKEKREPFFMLYEKEGNDIKTITFEGTIKAVSSIPDPESNDYPNCLYALFIEIDSLLSDVAPGTKIASEAIINAPIMKNKEIIDSYRFLSGDKIVCCCAEFDDMPQEIQEIQLSDDIQSFEHSQYFPFSIEKIANFSTKGNRNFAKREITILPIQSLPKDEKASIARRERIEKEIAKIEEEIRKHGGSFEAWNEEYKSISMKYKELCKDKWSGWINDSYFATGGNETGYRTKEYIEGIMPYKKYLEENNIDLIVVRIPSKWDFAARVLASDEFQENPAWVEHYYQCLKNDIEIIDPMPEMYNHRFDFPLFYYFNAEIEAHPHEGTFYCTAEKISEALKRYDYTRSKEPITLADAEHKRDTALFYYPEGNPKYDPASHIAFHRAIICDEVVHFLRNTNSPFLFVSNSFIGSRAVEQDLGIPQFVSFFLQTVPDWYYQSGLGNQMLRNLIANSTLLNAKKVVIMGAAPGFWNSFPPLPKYIADKAERISLEKVLDFGSKAIDVMNNNSFLIEKDSPNSFVISSKNDADKDSDSPVVFSFTIPPVKDKKTCMVRLVLNKAQSSNYLIRDAVSNEMIDSCTVTNGLSETSDNADLFVPMSDSPRQVVLELTLRSKKPFYFRNIELWYY